MPNNEEVDEQLRFLNTYRRTLATYLQRRAMLGTAHLPPEITHGITETRNEIRRIKSILQAWGIPFRDHPDDEEGNYKPDLGQPIHLTWPVLIGVLSTFIIGILVWQSGLLQNKTLAYSLDEYTVAYKHGELQQKTIGNHMKNFVLETTLITPQDKNFINTVPLIFFRISSSSYYKLAINQKYMSWLVYSNPQDIESDHGSIMIWNLAPGSSNHIKIIAYESMGCLYLNHVFAKQFSLSRFMQYGSFDLGIDAGVFEPDKSNLDPNDYNLVYTNIRIYRQDTNIQTCPSS